MKKVLFIVMCVAVCACSQNKEKKAQEALFDQIHQDYVESTKYQGIVLKENADDAEQTLDVYIKKGEEITDMTVLSEDSRCVQVVFNNYERVYNIFFPKGEKILTWGTEFIKTSDRAVKLNLIYEK